MKKYLLVASVLLSAFTFTSCSKDDDSNNGEDVLKVDIRDEYVGVWDYDSVGSVEVFMNGSLIQESPANKSGQFDVSKLGEDKLKFVEKNADAGADTEEWIYTVEGNSLTIADKVGTETVEENGMVINYVESSSGTLVNSKKITINSEIDGDWSVNESSGTMKGKALMTLTRD